MIASLVWLYLDSVVHVCSPNCELTREQRRGTHKHRRVKR